MASKYRKATVEDDLDNQRDDAAPRTRHAGSKGARDGRSSKDKARSDSGYSSQALYTGSETSSPILPKAETTRERTKDKDDRGRKSSGANGKSPRKSSRPATSHGNRGPKLDTDLPVRTARPDPSYYGQSADGTPFVTQTAAPSRPKSAVPHSPTNIRHRPYAGVPVANYPPPSRSAYANALPMPTSFPPPPTSYISNYGSADPSYFPPQSQPIVTRARHLADRFQTEPIPRSASAAGMRRRAEPYYEVSDYEPAYDIAIGRRNSIHARVPVDITTAADDRRKMPPPDLDLYRRPMSRLSKEVLPGPFDSEDDDGESAYNVRASQGLYTDVAPARQGPTRNATFDSIRAQPTLGRPQIAGTRAKTYYGESIRTSNYEENLRNATGYLNETGGGPPVELTADALRRATASTRSTRSTHSREDSEAKHSTTTRTSKSGSGHGDDVTVKLNGKGTLRIAGAEIDYNEGTELNFSSSRRASIRNGSEPSGSEFTAAIDDRRGSRDSRRKGSMGSQSKNRRRSTQLPPNVRYVEEAPYSNQYLDFERDNYF
ncbi:MAG: hypothetical protein M1818_005655 [Claussenomyces sp. TS43310]|nr:MAG: hypothetical protein M1818_005655 [Claussenomyces sp. TS43310]